VDNQSPSYSSGCHGEEINIQHHILHIKIAMVIGLPKSPGVRIMSTWFG